jgi:outer membrane protein OmpA-like peptidoglycan-associated protein
MTSRTGRHLVHFGLAALIGAVGQAAPAMAQSYLADGSDSGSVTVDYSVLGQGGAGPMTSGTFASGALPSGTCSCANAPLGVIAAAPRPTFNNPFGTNVAMQAPAVPPGFMTYAQATGAPALSGSNGTRIVLHAPAADTSEPQMAETPVEPANEAPLPTTTQTANQAAPAVEPMPAAAPAPAATEPTESQAAALPKTTQTQSVPSANSTTPSAGTSTADAGSGSEIPPAQPDNMPTSVPSPVAPGETIGNVAQAPSGQIPPAGQPAQTPPAAAPEQAPSAPSPDTTQTANAGTAGTDTQNAAPPAAPATDQSAQPSTTQPSTEQPAQPSAEQQAAVTPAAPTTNEAAATPAPASGATLPAGAYRVLYTTDSDDVPAPSNGDLDKVAASMLSDQNMRVQILAYAAGTEDTESKARRKSLARGLAIRSYLIKAGVPSTRIDVRALGSKADGGPADRVDIVPAS